MFGPCYQQALKAAGRKPLKKHIGLGDFTHAGGQRAMGKMLDDDPSIDAVFAASDLTALGAIAAITGRGLRVPQDIAVVGFDDVREASLAVPALTTVRQPIDELGRTMARKLLARIAGFDPARTTVLPVDVVRRASA